MEHIIIILIFILGVSIGSFLNVCIYRIPLNKSIVSPGSSCTRCGYKLKPLDLIPLLSYIFLRGKCRNCEEKISVRYPLIEFLTGVLFAITYLQFELSFKTLVYLIIISILVAIFFIDLDHMIIPDGANLAIGILGIVLNLVYPQNGYIQTLLNMLYGFLLGGILFLIFGYMGAMGGGDIKLMAMLGLVFGWKLLIPLMFLSFFIGGVVGIILLTSKLKKIKDMIPFGPYIALASVIIMFYGNSIVNWYLGSFI